MNRNGSLARTDVVPTRQQLGPDLIHEVSPRRTLTDLVLNATVRAAVDELVQEHHRADLLRSYNLHPRNRLLLTGTPGNGKTSLAEALASALMVPLVAVRYDRLITSYLGETALRLRRLFDLAHTRRCVLFFDELDIIRYSHSFSGYGSDRPPTQLVGVEPLAFNNLTKTGWYLRSSGIWNIDYGNHKSVIPVGFGIGKVTKSVDAAPEPTSLLLLLTSTSMVFALLRRRL